MELFVRFVLGPKPYATDFDPAGWTEVRVPPYWVVMLAGLLMAAILSGIVVLLLYHLAPACLRLRGSSYAHWKLIVLFLLTIPAHEMVHALLQPGLGTRTIFGFWPRRLVFYAFFAQPRTRRRILLGAVGPFLALSILPVILAALLDVKWWGIAALAFINAFSSSADVSGFLFVLARIPRGALVQAQQRRGYWRVGDGSSL